MSSNKIIVIAGPTASGKSGLALALAQKVNGIVINADSMQVYKDIPILAASPNETDKSLAPHKLYGIYKADVRGNVVDWLNLCKQEIALARQNHQIPIIVGGTGMYIEALTKGVTPIPETPSEIRQKVTDILENEGLSKLYELIQQTDSATAERLSPNDTTRIRRAAEIWYHTGKNLSYWHKVPLITDFSAQEFVTVYLKPSREKLDSNARLRFDVMMKLDALTEVRNLLQKNIPDSYPVMRALGVQELKAYLQNETSLEEAVELAKLHTRQYAKRQTTWFNNRFQADFILNKCFSNDKNIVDDIPKAL